MADEARVTYRAVANFLALKKAAAAARKDLQAIQKEEAKTNAASIAGSKKVASAHRDTTKALRSRTTSTKTATNAILAHNKALKENLDLQKKTGSAAQTAAAKLKTASSVTKDAAKEVESLGDAHTKTAAAKKKSRSSTVRFNDENRKTPGILSRVASGANNVLNKFRRLSNWRPRLTPPFIALLPLIAGLLALLNPLVSTLGAVGAAAFGAGSSLLSLGGAAVAIVPMIAAAIGAVAGLVTAFNGIGGVFSKFGAAQKAMGGGGGGGGRSAADQAWDLMKAQERLSDAQERAADAQANLNDAREEARERLQDLQDQVNQNVLDEADAAARLQQATEDYYNTMADPGSTLGDKMAATADLAQAQQDLSDSQKQSIEDAEELADAQKKGVKGDERVIQAQRNLRDSLRAVRDAQHDLNKQVNGGGSGGGGGVSAMNEFHEALAKLSPSAQKFVLAIIAMQGAWEDMQRTVQEAFFSKIVDDFDELEGMIPVIGNLLSKAAGAMGRFAHNFIMMVSSPAWKSDLGIISEQNVRLIDLAGEAALYLLDALKEITIAAGPMAEDLLRSFRNLMESFSDITARARDTGSLAKWLSLVYSRLQQWWRIIKNVAGTLFNYGAAAGEFGKWITDGLESMTENWLKASEEARKEGSPFKKWLEEIKPLLSEVRGLFGDFFRWLGKTAMDSDAITQATDIISDIRTELGPALADLFNTLNESGIGEAFTETLSSLVRSLQEIIDAGGAEGFKSFFSIISGFFGWLADVLKDPIWGPAVTFLAKIAGTFAALSFIGKFTGIFALFRGLTAIASSAAVMRFLGLLPGLKSLTGIKGVAAGTASGVAGATGGTVVGGAAGVGKKVAGAAGKAGIIGAIAAGVIKLVTDSLQVGGTIADQWGNITSGDPTRMGAAGDEIGRTSMKQSPFGLGPGGDMTIDAIDAIFQTDLSGFWDDLVDGWVDGVQPAIRQFLFTDLPGWFAQLPTNIAAAWNNFWTVVIPGIGPWLAARGAELVQWFTVDLPFSIGAAAGTLWFDILPALGGWLTARWTEFYNWIISIPGAIGSWAAGLWSYLPSIWTWLQTKATEVYTWAVSLPSRIGSWLRNMWSSLPSIWSRLNAIRDDLIRWARGLPQTVANAIGNLFSRVGGWFTTSVHNLVAGFLSKGAIGGLVGKTGQYLAAGGRVRRLGDSRYNMDPRGTDTEPAMLTPGEYVVKKERVDDVGPDNMQAFNDGMLSFAQLMSLTSEAKKNKGVNYFDGGGLAGRPLNPSAISSSMSLKAAGQTVIDQSMNFGDIHIHNPKRERSSVSLPSAIRKVSYAGGRRKPSPRLEREDR